MVARLVECSDNDVVYGVLIVKDISIEKVQEKIYEIKNQFYKDGFDDWCIGDVLKKFPIKWDWQFIQLDNNIIVI